MASWSGLSFHPRGARGLAVAMALAAPGGWAWAQQEPQQVTITGSMRSSVEKSYRKMLHGMHFFEKAKAAVAPQATLRFKLLPRKPRTDMDHVLLELIGSSFSREIAVAPDHTFVLPRDAQALDEDAVVAANRRQLSMTWRAEVRTPGLPAGTRRLGDLRLECEVGLEAGLVSNSSPIGRIADLFRDSRRYCDRPDTMYLFFADRPLFNVTLVAGARREALPIDRLYAMASDDPGLKDDLPYCDCEVLVDRTYFLPLGDHGWPDDTRVEFEAIDDAAAADAPVGVAPAAQAALDRIALGRSTKAELAAALGRPIAIPFDSGYEIWAYRWPGAGRTTRAASELVVLFDPAGVAVKARVRPGYAGPATGR